MSQAEPFSEINASATPMERRLRSPLLWLGVIAVSALVAGGMYFYAEREKQLARDAYALALRDYRAAGLPDPFAKPTPGVPVAKEGNLACAPMFDGLTVYREGKGAYAGFSWNESAAIRSRVDEVGLFTLAAGGAPFWEFDPATHFSNKSKPSRLVSAPAAGEAPAAAFIRLLEQAFPALKDLAAIEAAHPVAAVPEPIWSTAECMDFPMPDFKSARATGQVLTAYAGAKALEGDGAPAAATVCGLARVFESPGKFPGESLVDGMIKVVITKFSLPRLTHVSIREGVWSDEQLRRVGECLDRVRMRDQLLASIQMEYRASLAFLQQVSDDEPAARRFVKQMYAASGSMDDDIAEGLREPAIRRNGESTVRWLMDLSTIRTATGQLDLAKLVAIHDALVTQPPSSSNVWLRLATPAFHKVLSNAVIADAQVGSARVACALELYRRAHGAYPENLAALVPGFLPAVPLSPWAGGKIEYAVKPEGYMLRWVAVDYFDSTFGGLAVDRQHPGPWEVFGQKIELPAKYRWFDTVTVSTTTATPKDVVWTMPVPKPARAAKPADAAP